MEVKVILLLYYFSKMENDELENLKICKICEKCKIHIWNSFFILFQLL